MSVRVILALASLAFVSARPSINLRTVEELDIDKYIGRWYQTWGNHLGWLSYGDDAVCNTATYQIVDDSTISVLNHNRKDRGDGEERFITGEAYRTEDPGKFLLYFEGAPTTGNYWVIQLGPVVDDMYDYSVVTNADYTVLFVLARDVERFKEVYEDDVLAFLESVGFTDYLTRPIPDYHPDNCQYPPYP